MVNRKILVTVIPIFALLFFALPYYSRYSADSGSRAFEPLHPQNHPTDHFGHSAGKDKANHEAEAAAALSDLYAAGNPAVKTQQDAASEGTLTSTTVSGASTSVGSNKNAGDADPHPYMPPLATTLTTSTIKAVTEEKPLIRPSSTSVTSATVTSASSSATADATDGKVPSKTVIPHLDDDGLPRIEPAIPTGTSPAQVIDYDHTFTEPSLGMGSHPIDELIKRARLEYAALKRKRTITLEAAANAYRERRGRHPPPGFDQWWEFSQQKGSIIIEDMFDQIYHDIEPFWGLKPEDIRVRATEWHEQVTIRNGTATEHTKDKVDGAWLADWTSMLQNLDGLLPDVDMAFNNLDESRIMVPWEDINSYIEKANQAKNTDPPTAEKPLVQEYQALPPLPENAWPDREEHPWEDWHNGTPQWHFTRKTCPPDSEARSIEGASGNETSPFFPQVSSYPVGSYHGYVGNWTFARSACANPSLRHIHGTFIKPRWVSVNQTLFPLFGGSKVHGVNNEIIVPAAKYWTSEVEFSGNDDPSASPRWEMMLNKAVWRGAATGGDHNETNWRGYHRHRFLSMMNGTQVMMTEDKLQAHDNHTDKYADDDESFYNVTTSEPILPHNFPFPDPSIYPLAALKTKPTTLGKWSDSLNDGSFVHLMCHPQHISQFGEGNQCFYYDQFYSIQQRVGMGDQFMHKYLPDIDGNSYSGRYRAFLRSGSVPIKSTIYTEWHDARLVPWVHFVPMDNSFADYWGILEYFVGYEEPGKDNSADKIVVPGHDEVAKEIAEEGKRWANSVLRHEDMLVYMHRLVLEYARVTNDRREEMGWAGDLE